MLGERPLIQPSQKFLKAIMFADSNSASLSDEKNVQNEQGRHYMRL